MRSEGEDCGTTARQREVLALVARGDSSRKIAERLGISLSTVETHIVAARASLAARTRTHAAALVVPKGTRQGCPLTCEERRLLELLADGLALGEAADKLHLSRRTADRRLSAARAKLRVGTTAEAVLLVGSDTATNSIS